MVNFQSRLENSCRATHLFKSHHGQTIHLNFLIDTKIRNHFKGSTQRISYTQMDFLQ